MTVYAGTTLAALTGMAAFNPGRAARIAAGLEAHSVCSAVFVQGVDAAATDHEMVQLMTGPAGKMLRYTLDRAHPGVDASFAGLVHARADFTPGYGCRLRLPGGHPAPLAAARGGLRPGATGHDDQPRLSGGYRPGVHRPAGRHAEGRQGRGDCEGRPGDRRALRPWLRR